MVGMELEVAGIGRIAGAKIRLDGVTVIAGENNTGKTTIGKAALALIDGRFDLDRRMTDATRRTIQNAVQDGMIPADEDETWSQRRQTILQTSERTNRFLESPDMSVGIACRQVASGHEIWPEGNIADEKRMYACMQILPGVLIYGQLDGDTPNCPCFRTCRLLDLSGRPKTANVEKRCWECLKTCRTR